MQKMRNLILKYLPFLRDLKQKIVWGRALKEWQSTVDSMPAALPSTYLRRVLMVPPDPHTLTGSRGDDAMIEALQNIACQNEEPTEFYIVTGSDEADAAARSNGLTPFRIWDFASSPSKMQEELRKLSPDALIIIGADVMDGYYSPYMPLYALIMADLATRLGARSYSLGFSFNQAPRKELKEIFEAVHEDVKINLRDPVSLERFKRFCAKPAELVADAAFCLKPALDCEAYKTVAAWSAQARKNGHIVLAFNIHPLLFKQASAAQIQKLVTASANAIEAISKAYAVSWLLLPHDFRKAEGDNVCLTPLAGELSARGFSQRFYHLADDHSASELKAVVSLMDGTITARMHLAIASLGMGVPAAGIVYQGKFQGLFRHFGLSDEFLVEPDAIIHSNDLEKMMIRFIEKHVMLKNKVAEFLPTVLQLSEKNFSPLMQLELKAA